MGLFLLRAISRIPLQSLMRWCLLAGERDLGHPWPQAERLLRTGFECHIYLVSILFYLCFELLKWKPALRCYVGVPECCCRCSVSGRMQGCFLRLSPPLMSITPKSPAPSKPLWCSSIYRSLKQSRLRKNTAVVWPCTTSFVSSHQWESGAHLCA